MAKFYGMVGYANTVETRPGVWTEQITERPYYGDLLKNFRRLSPSDKLNDDVSVANDISIVSDAFAIQNFHTIRYVIFRGVKWKVTNVEVSHPRLVLSMGEVYNG